MAACLFPLADMKTRVTLREVAAAAGVHYSTVSLALRDHPRITVTVRRKIQKIAAGLGYVPDPALSALNAYRKTKLRVHFQSTIAWIDNWPGPLLLRAQPTFNEYFLGAQERARQLGYELEEFSLGKEGTSGPRFSKILQSRGIEGLLLPPQLEPGPGPALDYGKFSVITFGYSLRPHVFHLVTNHQFHSVTTALEKLVALGYKRIGLFLHAYIDEKVDNAYATGFWRFFHRHPELTCIDPCVIPDTERDLPVFREWFLRTSPDVIISDTSLPVADWLRDLGKRVPRDVGVVQLSVASDETHVSGINENGLLIGRTAMDFLIGMLQRGERGAPETPIRILVEGAWREGGTVRRQKNRRGG